MARFADYYIRYKYEFAPHCWEDRQKHLAALLPRMMVSSSVKENLLKNSRSRAFPMQKFTIIAFIIWRVILISS